MELRTIVKSDDYIAPIVYEQLEKMDFSNYQCSPLINGGCGLGKTTAFINNKMYDLFKRKTGKEYPRVLLIESRSMTRDQKREECNLPFFDIKQFYEVSQNIDKLSNYDIIIIDEAHSLFTDSAFAPNVTAPVLDWLNKSLCFQIYITASDIEFAGFAYSYFDNRDFQFTFPNLSEAHVRYTTKEMYLTVSSEKVEKIIERKEKQLLQPGKKGIFFIIAAKTVSRLYDEYKKKYRCGFYISQQNSSCIKSIIKNGVEEDRWEDYIDRYEEVNILKKYKELEEERKECGKEPIRAALRAGHIPEDIDYLFITNVGQEGFGIIDTKLDFVFIEDTYPLSMNQKLFRCRDNIEKAYIHFPLRRLQQALENSLDDMLHLKQASQEFLAGYYFANKTNRYSRKNYVYIDKETGKYKIAENYLIYLLEARRQFQEIKTNIADKDYMRAAFGQYADNFYLTTGAEDKKKDILQNYFSNKDGVLLTETVKGNMLTELVTMGLTNSKQEKDFTFDYVVKVCKEYQVCDFVEVKANKKDVLNNPEIVYRKKYRKIKLL